MLVEGSKYKEFRIKTPEEQIQEYFSELKKTVAEGQNEPSEKIIYTADGREIFLAVIDPQKVFAEQTALMLEAHPDDAIMAGGVANISADLGVGVTYLTLTDGGARELEGYETSRELILERRKESVTSAQIAGGAMVINLGFPDADLMQHTDQAIRETRAIMKMLGLKYMVTTNDGDPHEDHAAGAKIGKKARRFLSIAHYQTDTQDGLNADGRPTFKTHYVTVDRPAKSTRDYAFEAHGSQHLRSVPVKDIPNVVEVINMTQVHGRAAGRENAAGLQKTSFGRDRLRTIFQKGGVEVQKASSSRAIFERAKTKMQQLKQAA